MSHWSFIVSRLWNYLSLYFLKPFDAINDTLTASLISRLDWSGEFVEIGSGVNIATRDLDLRGSGSIIGEEQSGFIKEVGTELYYQLLEEEINILIYIHN